MSTYARSPELMNPEDTVLVVVDVQQKLLPLVMQPARLEWNVRRLLDAVKELDIPAIATEQFPRGLGATIPELAARLGEKTEKLTFSCSASAEFRQRLEACGRSKVLLCGMETHVCIQQTALDLIADGYRVYLAVDAISARHQIDHATAIRRIETSGATLTTVEAAIFEWCFQARTPPFRKLSKLVQETPPGELDTSG